MSLHKIIAVVVTYQPDPSVLSRLLQSVVRQVAAVIIVDNGSTADLSMLEIVQGHPDHISLVLLRHNEGVAAAQNRGIAEAIDKGATHFLLLDHDSIPEPGMVEKLFSAWEALTRTGEKIAAVGPRYRFPLTRRYSYFVRFGVWRFQKIYCPGDSGNLFIPVDFLISSGCLIPADVIADVGWMDEGLFIDHVDTDWFLRARAKGYVSFGVCVAMMDHALGDSLIPFWFCKKKMLPIHHPLRLYYIFRNSFLLYRRPYSVRQWRRNDLVRLGLMFFLFSTSVPPRRQYFIMMARGIRDGIRGISGRYPF